MSKLLFDATMKANSLLSHHRTLPSSDLVFVTLHHQLLSLEKLLPSAPNQTLTLEAYNLLVTIVATLIVFELDHNQPPAL